MLDDADKGKEGSKILVDLQQRLSAMEQYRSELHAELSKEIQAIQSRLSELEERQIKTQGE